METRRQFLANVTKGAIAATVGFGVVDSMGLAPLRAFDGAETLSFGPLESLVCLLQETPPAKLLPALVEQLKSGTELRRLVAAAALANARTFGGEDYIGFHTMMELSPSFRMSTELPAELQPLPVLKVLYRNTARIEAFGGRAKEVLQPVKCGSLPEGKLAGEAIRDAVRARIPRAPSGCSPGSRKTPRPTRSTRCSMRSRTTPRSIARRCRTARGTCSTWSGWSTPTRCCASPCATA